MAPSLSTLVFLVVFLSLPSAADAQESHSPATETGHSEHGLAGIRVVNLVQSSHAERTNFMGPGAVIEFPLVEGVLDLEVGFAVLLEPSASHNQVALPVDLVLKLPVHLDEVVTVYGGGGAVMNVAYRDSEARAIHFGPMLTLGAYAWNARGWGLNVEVDYAVLYSSANVEHEFEVITGVVRRF